MNKEEAINVIKGARQYLTVGNPIWNVKKVDEAMNMAIEALSERTGEWIDKGNWMGIECSRCKCHSRYVTPFCPQCGARMKGGVE